MRSGVGLSVLCLLCLHSPAFGQNAEGVPPGILIFCDDPSVGKAAHSAVHKFNEKISTGNKLALYQIQSASKSENGSDSLYSLQFTSRRSDCPADDSKPWTDCDYLPTGRKRPISCNATVHMTETETETKQVDCLLDDYIIPEKASCLGCPEKIDLTSEDLKVPLSVSISKYNSISDSTHLFTLHSVGDATRQVVAGFRFKLRFDVKKTTCAKAEHTDLNELCVPDEQDAEFSNCNSTVDVAPWRLEPAQAQIECEAGALPTWLTRRRPPGWSPLRHLLYDVPSGSLNPPKLSNSSLLSVPPQPPTNAGVKEESSEEDISPFHCPTKPWKPFNPAPPTSATAAADTTQPSADQAFSDTDLLA